MAVCLPERGDRLMQSVLIADALYRPTLSLLMIGLLALCVVLSVAMCIRRERSGWTGMLRLAGVAGLVWLLLGPSQTQPGLPSKQALPKLVIFVDTSASMAEADVRSATDQQSISRLTAVTQAWLNEARTRKLGAFSEVEILAFDEQTRPAPIDQLKPDGKATRLFDALAQSDADVALILSDGHDTTALGGIDATNGPGNIGRIFAVPVGNPRSAPDLALQAWPASDRLLEGQATTIVVALTQRGFADRSAVIELLQNGEVIETRSIILSQTIGELRFDVTPPLAPQRTVEAHHYRARVRLAEGQEAYTENNAEDLFIQVSRGRVKVLLIEGEPYWDTRSLARLIGGHPRFDLTAVFAFGGKRSLRRFGDAIEPGNEPTEDLQAFDIVVLGRHVERLVEQGFATDLVEWVRGGGAVVFARGLPFDRGDPLGRELLAGIDSISPVTWAQPVVGEMRVRLGSGSDPRGPLADLQDDAVLSRLPGMLAATRIEGRKTASLVLLEQKPGDGPAMAALTSLRVGSGVTMAVLTEGLWRWELLPGVSGDARDESVYGVFWVRAMQWLASGGVFLPGQDIALEADRLGVEPGENVTLTVSTRYIETDGLDPRLSVLDAGGKFQPLQLTPSATPGRYVASFTPTENGIYTFQLQTPRRDDLIDPDSPLTTRLAVVERSPESRDTSAKPELLKQLTESTGGRCLALDEPDPLLAYLQTLQVLRQPQQDVDYHFNHWLAFVWIAGCFGLEWILRRRSGLR